MLRVMIVDDEQPIIDLIKHFINKDIAEVIGEAANGLEAFEKIAELHPDVVITDIYMPGLKGTNLIEKAHELFAEVDFIIISGHQNFYDAKNAINYGVKDYLLKPINEKELNRVLNKINKQRMEKQSGEKKIREIEASLKKTYEFARKDNLKNTLERWDNGDENGKLSEELFQSGNDAVNFFIISADNKESALINDNYQKITEHICSKLVDILNDKCMCDYTVKANKGYFIISYDEKKTVLSSLTELMNNFLKNEKYKYPTLEFFVGIGKKTSESASFYEAYYSAKVVTAFRINKLKSEILNFSELPFGSSCEIEKSLSNDEVVQLKQLMLQENKEKIVEFVGSVMEKAASAERNALCLYSLAGSVIKTVEELINESAEGAELFLPDKELYVNTINAVRDKEKIIKYTKDYVFSGMENFFEYKKNEVTRPVRLLKKYIAENYKSNISLETAASELYMNYSYLSRLFKKQEGMSFSEYLIFYRMEKAKDILKNTNISVTEVAEEVGYTDARHFSKTFAKIIGITPTQYRNF